MEHESHEKRKPRGRPFPKGNIRGKILADTGHNISHEGGNIETKSEEKIEIPVESTENSIEKRAIIETLDFMNGTDKLSIRFTKKTDNRVFRIQIFLNDELEIRPVTYAGSSSALCFWNLLKTQLKQSRS